MGVFGRLFLCGLSNPFIVDGITLTEFQDFIPFASPGAYPSPPFFTSLSVEFLLQVSI